jgi:hypothetical protein
LAKKCNVCVQKWVSGVTLNLSSVANSTGSHLIS